MKNKATAFDIIEIELLERSQCCCEGLTIAMKMERIAGELSK